MKKTPLFTSRSLFFVILTSYKVQTPYYFFDFWRILARERLQNVMGLSAIFFTIRFASTGVFGGVLYVSNPDYSRRGSISHIYIHIYMRCAYFGGFFARATQNTPLPPLADRVTMLSGGRVKGVGTFGGPLVEMPPGPVTGELDYHPPCTLNHRGRHLDDHAAPGARLTLL